MCNQMPVLSKTGTGLDVSPLIGKSSHETKGEGIAFEYLSPTQTLEVRQKEDTHDGNLKSKKISKAWDLRDGEQKNTEEYQVNEDCKLVVL
ncbi:hypothetical protein C5167_007677 [Papaver somniferum]|nr:hypothetical protein C5167_007677 [Papaver somniferum]